MRLLLPLTARVWPTSPWFNGDSVTSLRVPAEMHSRMAMQAEAAGKSLNQWATDVLEEAIHA